MAGVRAGIALGLWLWQAALSQAFGSDFAYGRALYVGDRTYFLVDTKPNAKAESSPTYILPNQVLVLDKESGEFYCQASDTCLSNSRSSIIISPVIIPTLVALDSSGDSGLPLLYKRYAFGSVSTHNGIEMVAERNVRGQIGIGTGEEIDKKEWGLKSFNVFYELRLEAGQKLTLYKTPQISQKASQNVVLEIHAAPQPYATSPREPLAKAKAKTALLDERERAQILGDRVFLIGYEKGFYQAVVIVNESVYFWGYIDEAAIQALPANATQLAPSALPAFTKTLFTRQPTLQEMRQTHQKKIHTLLKPKPKDLAQMLTIAVIFDTKSGRISLADSALLPYLPISQEIDYYLSQADRIKLADKAKSLGYPSINAALRMYIDMPSLSYLHLEPEVKLVRLELESSQSLQEPRLCIGGNLRYKRYLEVYADSKLSQLSTRIDKLDLALGELALLQTLPSAKSSANAMFISFRASHLPPISGYIASDSISMCKDTDSSALPDYALAKTMLSIIENAEFKPIDSTTHALFHNKSSKGYRYTGLKSLKQTFAKANALGLSPLELVSLKHSSIDKSHKYGGDRFVSYDREGYNYPAQAHIVLLSEQEKATRILLIYPRETYLLSDNEAVFIAMGSLDFAK
ncbi:hypothetical protein [Helicobacter canis]|uniref:Uncharacterized protein n=1 Tax=Helicobacter canis TaxID=29419 RepID=A0A5M9QQ27_9HELI|nr:hypothetical protein [Helicobacter canis]KAA8710087.1 hypothetical protein F4V45_03715 [Helicobacter canis]